MEKCVVISGQADPAAAFTVIRDSGLTIGQLDGPDDDWRRIEASGPEGALLLDLERYDIIQPDPVARDVRGWLDELETTFSDVTTDFTIEKEDLLEAIETAEIAVRATATPEFLEHDSRGRLVFAIAARLGGLVLADSLAMRSDGTTLLDLEGNSQPPA